MTRVACLLAGSALFKTQEPWAANSILLLHLFFYSLSFKVDVLGLSRRHFYVGTSCKLGHYIGSQQKTFATMTGMYLLRAGPPEPMAL